MNNTDILEITARRGGMELTKTTAAEIAHEVVAQVEDGEISPLDTLAKLTWLSTITEQAIKEIRQFAVTEAEKYPAKTFAEFGVDFELSEVGVKYDYSGNPDWDDRQSRIECLKTEQKAIEVILKAQGSYAKTSTTTVKVKLRK